MIVRNAASLAAFDAGKMGKVTIGSGDHLHAGLNCFLPGQAHHAHVHADQDKLYVVLEGEGVATVGDSEERVGPGDVILARAGVPHGMSNGGAANLVVLTIFSPPPKPKAPAQPSK